MENKFTKGNWNISDDTGECYLVKSDDGGLIAFVYDGDIDDEAIHMDVVEANAKLIASAPELLEALESFVYDVENTQGNDNVFEEAYHLAKNAIKKATE